MELNKNFYFFKIGDKINNSVKDSCREEFKLKYIYFIKFIVNSSIGSLGNSEFKFFPLKCLYINLFYS